MPSRDVVGNFRRNIRRTTSFSLRRTISDKQSKPTLLRLAKSGKFDEMIQLLRGEDYLLYLDECTDAAYNEGTLNMFMGKSTLQLVMTYRPPVELVDLLIRRCREQNPNHCPEDSIDMQGRTPLHVAVEYGCSIKTCKRLMAGNLPVMMKDQQDRTPLHCACANLKSVLQKSNSSRSRYMSNQNTSSNERDAENMYKVISALVASYPEATQMPDIYGKTPILLAMENRAEQRILSLLIRRRQRLEKISSYKSRPSWDTKSPFEASFTITSDGSQLDDLSSVGSCGISAIEI